MQNPIYKIKEFFRSLNQTFNPYCLAKKLQEETRDFEKDKLKHRFSVLERLTKQYGEVGLIPLELFERQAGIKETREVMRTYIPCCS